MRIRISQMSCWIAGCVAAMGIAGFACAADKMEDDRALLLEPIVQKDKPVPPPKTAPAPTKKNAPAPITIKGEGSSVENKPAINKPAASKAIIHKPGATGKTTAASKKTTKAPAVPVDTTDKPKDDAKRKEGVAKAAETRKQDIAKLREIEKQGGAYFYTMDNKPISDEELDKRIEKGDVAGIKTVDLHLQEWKTKTKAEAPQKGKATQKPKSDRRQP